MVHSSLDSSLRRVVSIPVSEATRKGHAAAMKSNDDAVAEFADRKRKEPRATGMGKERTVRGSFEDKLRRLDIYTSFGLKVFTTGPPSQRGLKTSM